MIHRDELTRNGVRHYPARLHREYIEFVELIIDRLKS
jgi:hypothetical protein